MLSLRKPANVSTSSAPARLAGEARLLDMKVSILWSWSCHTFLHSALERIYMDVQTHIKPLQKPGRRLVVRTFAVAKPATPAPEPVEDAGALAGKKIFVAGSTGGTGK